MLVGSRRIENCAQDAQGGPPKAHKYRQRRRLSLLFALNQLFFIQFHIFVLFSRRITSFPDKQCVLQIMDNEKWMSNELCGASNVRQQPRMMVSYFL